MSLITAYVCLLIASPSFVLAILGEPFSCPPAAPNGLVYGSSCYDFDGEEKSWVDARDSCRRRGGRLAMIPNADVQNWLSSTAASKFPSRQGVWLGLHDRTTEGTFYWDNYNGQDILATYFNWEPGEPNNRMGSQDCAYMRRSYEWRWVDVECNMATFRKYSSICEFNALFPSTLQVSTRQTTTLLSTVTSRLPPAGERTSASLAVPLPATLPSSTQQPPAVQSSVASTAFLSQHDLASTASIDVLHPDMADYGSDLSAAGAAVAHSQLDSEAQDAHSSSFVTYIVVGVVALLVCAAVLAFLALCQRRRLRRRAKRPEEPPVTYDAAGVRGMENPLYSSLAQAPVAPGVVAEESQRSVCELSATQPLLAAAVGGDDQAAVMAAASGNEYVDIESMMPGLAGNGRGWLVGCDGDRAQSLGHIYAEPVPTLPSSRSSGDALQRSKCSKEQMLPMDTDTATAHVYAECGPPSVASTMHCQPCDGPKAVAIAASELNDLSKNSDGTSVAANGATVDCLPFGFLQLNVDDESIAESRDGSSFVGDDRADGGYECYKSEWQPYENVSKPS